jgi:hypothetical protein
LVVVQGRKLSRVRWHAVVVVGYGCYLRVALFAPALRWMGYGQLSLCLCRWICRPFHSSDDDAAAVACSHRNLLPIDVGFFEVCGLLFCIKKSREMNPA